LPNTDIVLNLKLSK